MKVALLCPIAISTEGEGAGVQEGCPPPAGVSGKPQPGIRHKVFGPSCCRLQASQPAPQRAARSRQCPYSLCRMSFPLLITLWAHVVFSEVGLVLGPSWLSSCPGAETKFE